MNSLIVYLQYIVIPVLQFGSRLVVNFPFTINFKSQLLKVYLLFPFKDSIHIHKLLFSFFICVLFITFFLSQCGKGRVIFGRTITYSE